MRPLLEKGRIFFYLLFCFSSSVCKIRTPLIHLEGTLRIFLLSPRVPGLFCSESIVTILFPECSGSRNQSLPAYLWNETVFIAIPVTAKCYSRLKSLLNQLSPVNRTTL